MAIGWSPSFLNAGVELIDEGRTARWNPGETNPWGVSVRAAVGYESGKRYWEIRCDYGATPPAGVVAGAINYLGYASDMLFYNGGGMSPNGFRYQGNGNGSQMTPAPLPSGGIIRVAADFDTGSYWFAFGPDWVYYGNPAVGSGATLSNIFQMTGRPGEPVYAAASISAVGQSVTLATHTDDFAYAPPAGFLPYDDSVSATRLQVPRALALTLTLNPPAQDASKTLQVPRALALGLHLLEPRFGGNDVDVVLPEKVALAAHGGGLAALRAPDAVSLRAVGTVQIRAAYLLVPDTFALSALGGGSATLLAPDEVALAATGTPVPFAFADLEWPDLPALVAAGGPTRVGAVALRVPEAFALAALGGGVALLRAPDFALAATGLTGAAGHALLRPEMPVLRATGTGALVGRAGLVVPEAFALLAFGGGFAALRVPEAFALHARDWANAALPMAENGERCFAVNLSTKAVTELVVCRFDKVLTGAGGRLYGLAGGTLYEMVPPVARVEQAAVTFAPVTFDTARRKHLCDTYILGRSDGAFTVDCVYDGARFQRYVTPYSPGPHFATHKARIGKGMAFWSVAITLGNTDKPWDGIAALELRALPHDRRV